MYPIWHRPFASTWCVVHSSCKPCGPLGPRRAVTISKQALNLRIQNFSLAMISLAILAAGPMAIPHSKDMKKWLAQKLRKPLQVIHADLSRVEAWRARFPQAEGTKAGLCKFLYQSFCKHLSRPRTRRSLRIPGPELHMASPLTTRSLKL